MKIPISRLQQLKIRQYITIGSGFNAVLKTTAQSAVKKIKGPDLI